MSDFTIEKTAHGVHLSLCALWVVETEVGEWYKQLLNAMKKPYFPAYCLVNMGLRSKGKGVNHRPPYLSLT